MSVRLDASGDHLYRTTNLPTITSFTMMAWVCMRATSTVPRMLVLGSSSTDAYYSAGIGETGTIFALYNGSADGVGSSSFSTNVWTHVAMTVAGTGANQFLGYFNGANQVTMSGRSNTAQRMEFGNDAAYSLFFNGAMAAIKVWSAVLTAAEINQELRQILPVRTLNLNSFYPFFRHTELGDFGGNGYTLTTAGTFATEDGPPIPWGGRFARLVLPVAEAPPAGRMTKNIRSMGLGMAHGMGFGLPLAS